VIERRYTTGGQDRIGILTRDDGNTALWGYAAVFYRADDPGTQFQLWDDVFERIKPTAFSRAVREDDIRALFNHDANIVLGRNRVGTLRLSVDEVGLRYEIDPPDNIFAASVVESIRRGDVFGSSFSFLPETTVFREEKIGDRSVTIVERESVRVLDVGPVTFPAYASTSTGLRSASEFESTRKEVEAWRSSLSASPTTRRDIVEASARVAEVAIGRRR